MANRKQSGCHNEYLSFRIENNIANKILISHRDGQAVARGDKTTREVVGSNLIEGGTFLCFRLFF
jgi:hypothetical protein